MWLASLATGYNKFLWVKGVFCVRVFFIATVVLYIYLILRGCKNFYNLLKILGCIQCKCIFWFTAAKLQLNEDGVKTGLVLEPYSQCIVMNSHPGHLQFYSPEQNRLWMEVGNSLFHPYMYVVYSMM